MRRRTAGLVLMLACTASAASAGSASAATQTFGSTGAEQTFTVPAGVSLLHVMALGGKGGKGSDESAKKLGGPGGAGASVEADLTVTAGQVLFIEVGGTGADGSVGGAGGFNGGGSSNEGGFKLPGGGGGGATDIRTCSRLTLSCLSSPDTLSSRLLVAAGGGGGGSDGRQEEPTGGEGGDASKGGTTGALLGCNTGSTPGGGGQAGGQSSGGEGGIAGNGGAPAGNAGVLGQGGAAGNNGSNSQPGGGGGGGAFGGGAGGGANGCSAGGGGGGSSFSTGTSNVIRIAPSGVPSVTIAYTRPPTVNTSHASGIGLSVATLNGAVLSEALSTAYFQYGTTTAYGSSTTPQGVSASVQPTAVSAAIGGLSPATVYHFRTVAENAGGVSYGADQTFTTFVPIVPVCSCMPLRLQITAVGQSRRVWREGSKLAKISKKRPPVGTTFSLTLNRQAAATFSFIQLVGGRSVHGRCVAQSNGNRRKRACTRTVIRGTMRFAGHSGRNMVAFQGRLSRSKKLRPGTYTLIMVATLARIRSSPKRLTFTIVK